MDVATCWRRELEQLLLVDDDVRTATTKEQVGQFISVIFANCVMFRVIYTCLTRTCLYTGKNRERSD